jgi:hypothetical protein
MIQKPIISENFTLEDIRKIRDYNDSIASTMTLNEYFDYINRKTEPLVRELTTRRVAHRESDGYTETASP